MNSPAERELITKTLDWATTALQRTLEEYIARTTVELERWPALERIGPDRAALIIWRAWGHALRIGAAVALKRSPDFDKDRAALAADPSKREKVDALKKRLGELEQLFRLGEMDQRS